MVSAIFRFSLLKFSISLRVCKLRIQPVACLYNTCKTSYNSFTRIFQAFAILSALLTGVLFALKSFKSGDATIRWKGRFLLIAFISFSAAAILDSGFALGIIGVIIIRLLLISSAIEYYLGFLLPDRIAKRLIRND